MNDLFNPEKTYRQKDISALLRITDRQVRTLVSQAVLPEAKPRSGYDPLECIHAFIRYKSQGKTLEKPEVGGGGLELTEEQRFDRRERKLKLLEREEKVSMMTAKRVLFEKTFGPLDIIVDVLQQLCGRLASRHDSLISNMKLAWPDMPQEAVEVLEEQLTAAANECTELEPDLSDYVNSDQEEGPAWLGEFEEENSGHRN